jgi:hypothetical protein
MTYGCLSLCGFMSELMAGSGEEEGRLGKWGDANIYTQGFKLRIWRKTLAFGRFLQSWVPATRDWSGEECFYFSSRRKATWRWSVMSICKMPPD